MNTTARGIRTLLLLMTLDGASFHTFATENCNVKKVEQAMIRDPGGIAQTALSKTQYKEKLDVKRVRITRSDESRHPDKTRLTVVIDKKNKVRHIYCQ